MQLPGIAMWDAQYDYVRLTARRGGEDDRTALLHRLAARACLAARSGGEAELRPWFWQGYYGETGDGVGYGSRPDGFIFQASGPSAADAREMDIPFDSVPRADIAVTIWYETDASDAIKHYAQVSRRFSASKGALAWKVTHIDGGKDGDTTYVGARTSDTFIRIYDKARESQGQSDYEGAIRYEVEFKGQAAYQVWAAAYHTAPGREYLAGLVRSTLAARGIFLPRALEASRVAAPKVERPVSSTDRRLAWLRSQVRPSIERLLTAGVSRDTILAELGLD